MARIRTVKPGFFRHNKLFKLEKESLLPIRVAFIGLWTACDRDGRFQWEPEALKLDCLPYDECNFEDVLDALLMGGFIIKYEVAQEIFGYIPSWEKHQVINQREAKSILPEPCIETHVPAHASMVGFKHIPNGVNLPLPLRKTVIARDGGKCVRCDSCEDLTVDHIFPQSIGGTHAITNLRCLCRSCNSARPVQGNLLIEDLAKDGLTLDDMQRMCMHVQSNGEGKGREGKGIGKEEEGVCDDASAAQPKKIVVKKSESETAPTWNAYALAYSNRYGAEPVRNASVNGKLSQFVKRIGVDESPHVASFFVGHNNAWYVRGMHDVGAMLKDCEKLRTEWATNTRMTSTRAAQVDKTQTNFDAWAPLIAEAEERERMEANGK